MVLISFVLTRWIINEFENALSIARMTKPCSQGFSHGNWKGNVLGTTLSNANLVVFPVRCLYGIFITFASFWPVEVLINGQRVCFIFFRSELALLYNDRCVLENHHLCSAFTLLKTVSYLYKDLFSSVVLLYKLQSSVKLSFEFRYLFLKSYISWKNVLFFSSLQFVTPKLNQILIFLARAGHSCKFDVRTIQVCIFSLISSAIFA